MAPSRRNLLARGVCLGLVVLLADSAIDFIAAPVRAGFRTQRPTTTALRARGGAEEIGEGGTTSLMLAAHSGDAAKVKTLLEGGANINARDYYGWTPLRYAVRQGNKEAVEALLDAKADINLASESQRTPLMSAVANELDEMATILVKRGADVKLADEDGLTAWDMSFRGGATRDPKIRELLKVDKVGDVNADPDLF